MTTHKYHSMPSSQIHHTVRQQALGLLGWLLLTFVAAAIGGFASASAGSFYAQLIRPAWAPPGWLFGPVWSVLYLLMGVSAWLVWRAQGWRGARGALGLFIAQLAVNALWTWLFFVWQLGGAAFVEIIVLWGLIVGTIVMFYRLHKPAAVLLLPYLAWVSFACALTYATWQLNPAILR
ncbi:MAG: tryptophan-rich sensory protein [Gammaproteobacteria bacterium]|nr:tryptophan-rich sensory protein [Gammaproteobacteria bacterium]MBU0786168.1 tryptophan-rich sensory protein [Gammaproteobacteria bacterium]MBU0816749.1 tryptophan-rich sensory protein [Gammaproteobacteria bacterium]MBU1786913.1 tryptophan-rich sensory protein [Gammaproteobacteria bacterium]